jgi:hypothetical protein
VQLLLSDARINPAACSDDALRGAAAGGHRAVAEALCADARVSRAAAGG